MKIRHSCGHLVHYYVREFTGDDFEQLRDWVKWLKEQAAQPCLECKAKVEKK